MVLARGSVFAREVLGLKPGGAMILTRGSGFTREACGLKPGGVMVLTPVAGCDLATAQYSANGPSLRSHPGAVGGCHPETGRVRPPETGCARPPRKLLMFRCTGTLDRSKGVGGAGDYRPPLHLRPRACISMGHVRAFLRV